MYAVQSKNGTMIHANVILKNQSIGILGKKFTYGILVRVIANEIKRVKMVSIKILKIVHLIACYSSFVVDMWRWDSNYNRDCY